MSLLCVDCRKYPDGHNYYMVHDHVWEQTGLGRHGGLLCLEHLETRIGRQITVDDLKPAPINLINGIIEFLTERSMRL